MSPSHENHPYVYLLGAFRIVSKAQSIRLPTRKTESLLAYLVLHPGAHSREKMAALFWGDSSEKKALGSLRKALTFLRKSISHDFVLADRETAQFNPSFTICVDVFEFEREVHGYLTESFPALDQINLDLYQGDLLPDLDEEWVLPLRQHYHDLYIDVLLRLVERSRSRSEYGNAIEYAHRILSSDSANERAHQHLMFCHVTSGDRNKALQQYELCQRALRDELAVEPTRETQALYQWIKRSDSDAGSLAARVTNLPIPISSFVGRNKELANVKHLISKARLVTLTGAGGSGKTRLAIHAATELIDSFKDGVWWVELAPIRDPLLVPSAVAKALGIDARSDQPLMETLKKYLRLKHILLVFDNCEHLIDASAHLAESLLTSCADVKILATSRETLDLIGEVVWHVPALSLPDVQNITLMELLMQYEGIRLFVERATAVNPEFAPNDEIAVAISQVCRRLDGIPLAIELAAARVKTMSITEISERLDDRFQLLTVGNRTSQTRHQTLRTTVDWSYDLLTEDERQLFCRLSVFSGGWTLDAAEAVCSGDGIEHGQIPDLLAKLADKSLITVDSEGQRYGMLETMRQYGMEKLAQIGTQDQIFERYLNYYLKMAESGDEKIRGPEQLEWFKWFGAEQDNLSNAMDLSLSSLEKVEKGCQLICSIGWYWNVVGDKVTMKHWLEMAYSKEPYVANLTTRAMLLFNVGFHSVAGLNWLEPLEAQTLLEQSLNIWIELGSEFKLQQTQCLLMLGWIQRYYFNNDDGIGPMKKAIHDFQEMGTVWWQAWGLNLWGGSLIDAGGTPVDDPDHAQNLMDILEEAITIWEKTGDECISSVVYWDFGTLAMKRGDFVEAQGYFQEALRRYRKFGARSWIASTLIYLGDNALGLKLYDLAESYFQEAMTLIPGLMWDGGFVQSCLGLGWVMLSRGNVHQAKEYFQKAQNASLLFGFRILQLRCIAGYGALAVMDGKLCSATRLFSAFYAQYESLKPDLSTTSRHIFMIDQMEIEDYLDMCKKQMNESEFEKAWNDGRLLSLDEAISEIEQFGS